MKRRLLTAGIAVLALTLAACGDGAGASDNSITMLVSYPADNLVQDFPEIATGALAAAHAINAAGGIDGRKINMLTCNNRDDANDSQTCARKAVQDNAVAVVGQADLYSNQSLPILQSAGIPSVGLYTVGVPTDQTAPNSFLLNAGSVGSNVAAAYALNPNTDRVVAQAASAVPVAVQQAQLSATLMHKRGVDVTGITQIPLTGATDFSPYAQKLKSTGADAIGCVISTTLLDGVIKATSTIGYKPLFLTNSQTYGEIDAERSQGLHPRMVIMSPYPSPRDSNDPLITAYDKESAAYAGKSVHSWLAGASFDSDWSNAVDAWLSVHAVAQAFTKSRGDLTASGLTKVLTDKSTNIDLYGQPWQPAYTSHSSFYPRVNTLPIYFLTIKHGKLVTLKGVPPVNLRKALG